MAGEPERVVVRASVRPQNDYGPQAVIEKGRMTRRKGRDEEDTEIQCNCYCIAAAPTYSNARGESIVIILFFSGCFPPVFFLQQRYDIETRFSCVHVPVFNGKYVFCTRLSVGGGEYESPLKGKGRKFGWFYITQRPSTECFLTRVSSTSIIFVKNRRVFLLNFIKRTLNVAVCKYYYYFIFDDFCLIKL